MSRTTGRRRFRPRRESDETVYQRNLERPEVLGHLHCLLDGLHRRPVLASDDTTGAGIPGRHLLLCRGYLQLSGLGRAADAAYTLR